MKNFFAPHKDFENFELRRGVVRPKLRFEVLMGTETPRTLKQFMDWSTEQARRIVEQFWQDGVARCPDDNGPLKLKLHRLQGGDYDLHAECPVCGKRKEFRRGDDPQRHRFRRWTTDEVHLLDRATRENSRSACPVCRAPVERQPLPSFSLLRCFRCGNSNQWHPAPAPQ